MDGLTFVARLVDALAWPSAVVISAAMLRPELVRLIRRVQKIKHKESEVDLAAGVETAKEEANRIPEFSVSPSGTETNRLLRLAEDGPRGAILDAWLGVEEAMDTYAQRHGLEVAQRNSKRIEQIEMHDLDGPYLGKGITEMLHRLRELRNNAVHRTDMDITEPVARDYVSLAQRVKRKLEEA
jgi:hypothetical protein